MDPALVELLEPAVVFATLLGTAFGVKLLVWGKGPIKQIRGQKGSSDLDQRMLDLEERAEHSAYLVEQQTAKIEDLEERLDFAERMLTRGSPDRPRALENPEPATPA